MEEEVEGFVAWKEEVVTAEKGRRLVHYYLIHTTGVPPILAVQGTERSLRHMIYNVSDDFVSEYGSLCHVLHGTKWRTRREVLDWLALVVSQYHSRLEKSAVGPVKSLYDRSCRSGAHLIPQLPDLLPRKLKSEVSDIVWNEVGWACSKQLMHYDSFRCNGVDIKVHSFVFIMAEEGDHYVGYLEDMYEDKRTQKKVKVRWFHRAEDIEYQLNAHLREVFITPQVQVISAECIEGPASVLTPKQYEQCVAVLPHSILCRVYMCFRQLRNNMITPFSISKLQGYFNQPVLSCINHPLFSKTKEFGEGKPKTSFLGEIKQSHKRKRPDGKKDGDFKGRKHLRKTETSPSAGSQVTKLEPSYPKLKIKFSGRILKHGNFEGSQPELSATFNINDEIELLCQDSGIRGCWFRCKVLRVGRGCLKVEYDDLQDAEKSGNLKEWVASCRVAAPDKMSMRYTGRLTTRPRPPEDSGECSFEVGAPVEVWWHDGWWEGVVIAANATGTNHLRIYLPGEDRYVTIEESYVRKGKDWVNGSWIDAMINPDILSSISAKSSQSISDHVLPPISELVEVNVSDQPSNSVANDPVLTGNEEYVALEKDFCKGEDVDAEVAQAIELLVCNVGTNGKHVGLDAETDFGFGKRQYDAPVNYVKVPVS